MKFGDKLKKQSEKVQTKEEARDTIETAGMLFRNCERYLCNLTGNVFYIVTDDNGSQFYLDQWMNEKIMI